MTVSRTNDEDMGGVSSPPPGEHYPQKKKPPWGGIAQLN